MIATGQSLLYVSTELDTWETSTPEPDQDEICERCGFRRLDPEYYAWLRHRMEVAKRARERGRLLAAQYQELRRRFNPVHFWATEHLGEPALLAAVQTLDPKTYRPPRVEDWQPRPRSEQAPSQAHLFPAEGDWPFTESIPAEAVARVDAIRDQALSLGWSEAGLYQNRGMLCFPNGDSYGLVCFLQGDRVIGEVTPQCIEIVAPSGGRLRHYNRDLLQPWLRRTPATEALSDPDTPAPAPVSNK